MMRSGGIGQYLYAIERKGDMRGLWRKHLLACLCSERGVEGRDDCVANRTFVLSGKLLYDVWQVSVFLNDPDTLPRREVSHLSVVPVLCQRQLWANQEDLLVVT